MMFFNRITAWRLKIGVHPQSILLWGIVVQFAANLSQLAAVLFFGLPPFWLLVACVMFSGRYAGFNGANTQACFMCPISKKRAAAQTPYWVYSNL